MTEATVLRIAHFNDVYQVIQEVRRADGQKDILGVAKFASILESITNKWPARKDEPNKKDGLVVFSGDLFSPSTESSTTRGAHLPAIINALNVDVGCAGNHEFDFGYPQLQDLVGHMDFPWLLSNIIDTNTNKVPECLKEFHVLERCGIRIGFIGLVEKDWIATVNAWPENFKYTDMAEVGRALSAKLREDERCDLVIAVTHSRFFNDIQLARELYALSPAAQAFEDITSKHGVDVVLGGHDHIYWISKGVTHWEGYDLETPIPDTETDEGDVLIVKSGTDYHEISEVFLTLKDTPEGSVRKKIIQSITGSRYITKVDTPVNQRIQAILDVELETINESLKEPICYSEVELDLRSVRSEESVIGNWITDCLKDAYDVPLRAKGYDGADAILLGSGELRSERLYPPGQLTMRDIVTILPFPEPLVVIEVNGNDLWDAFESGLSKWPATEGRFPVFSGFRVKWDGKRPAGERVLEIFLRGESDKVGPDGVPKIIDKEEITRNSTRKYALMTSQYISSGGDGYIVFKDKPFILDSESGQPKSALVRKFLLGAQLLNKIIYELPEVQKVSVSPKTLSIIDRLRSKLDISKLTMSLPEALNTTTEASASNEQQSAVRTLKWLDLKNLFIAALKVADQENMGFLDAYERCRARTAARLIQDNSSETSASVGLQMLGVGVSTPPFSITEAAAYATLQLEKANAAELEAMRLLPVIHPVIDGRFTNVSA